MFSINSASLLFLTLTKVLVHTIYSLLDPHIFAPQRYDKNVHPPTANKPATRAE